ncbi:tetratricopeptide repeat protein [Plebeiibacterium marinum]|uniref:Tetratricopeptide repeat protein n=1 Tax=Plebeiibacterium marinum TaxID=2992111 RepID=A0AAE3MEL9_9BACT|nr:tetratricopeptide repeat protein [Plebeiobacterium marinum]MCW3806190.1 tetratricopeptide repeat protein [Plebeiobacterium marinum]
MTLFERLFKKKNKEYPVTNDQVDIIENVEEITLFRKGAIVYIENEYQEDLNNLILGRYDFIAKLCREKGFHFVYLPKVIQNISRDKINEAQKYFNPSCLTESVENTGKYKPQDITSKVTSLIFNYFNYNKNIEPGFIRYRGDNEYSYVRILFDNESVFESNIRSYIANCRNSDPIMFRLVTSYHLAKEGRVDEIADCEFDSRALGIAKEIEEKISQLKEEGYYQLLLNTLSQSLNDIPTTKGSIIKQFQQNEVKPIISRIIIDEEFRIILPDYNNLEIKLTPLPKTVYLFFLRHPEGIVFKHLIDHKHELLYIYKLVSNRESEEEMNNSIEELIDPTKNSINEKCSRIKEAFVKHFDDSIAQYYYITGSRAKEKKITISQNKVIWKLDEKGLPTSNTAKSIQQSEQFEENERELIKKGHNLLDNENPEEAYNCFNKVLSSNPYHYDALCGRALACFDLQEFVNGVNDNTQAIEINYYATIPYHNRAECYFYLQQYELALTDINYFITRHDPRCPESYFMRGNIKEKLGDIKGACQDWFNAKSLNHPKAFAVLEKHSKVKIRKVRLDKKIYK